MLSGAYRLSKRQVRRLVADLLGLSISTGMVAKLQRRAAAGLAAPMAEIVAAVPRRPRPCTSTRPAGGRRARRRGSGSACRGRGDRLPGPSLARHDGLEALLGATRAATG